MRAMYLNVPARSRFLRLSKEDSGMKNENAKVEYQSPKITVTVADRDVITASQTKTSWEGPVIRK